MITSKKNIFFYLTLLLTIITSSAAVAKINAEIFKTPNNIEIVLLQDKTTDLISLNFGFKNAGVITDEVSKSGLTVTMMKLLFRSNADGMDRHDKARKVKELGILSDINFVVTDDDIELYFKCPQENLKSALALLSTFAFKADLNNTELNKIKNFGVGNTNLANAKETTFAWHTLRAHIFAGHPYANTCQGTQQGIQSLNLTDIKQAFSQKLAKDNLIVAVVGNIDKQTISNYVDETFANLAETATLPAITQVNAALDGQTKVIFKDTPQSTAIFAQQSIPFAHKDFYPLLILNRILGGEPFTSRLWMEIREKRGLVYNISTSAHANIKFADVMTGIFQCNNEDTYKVIAIIKQQWQTLKDNGVTTEEFNNAKTGLIGQYALNFVSPFQTSAFLLGNRLLGFDIQHINERNNKIKAVTIEEVNRVAKQHLQPEQLSFVVIGNP